jgi:hypothetical protein
VSAVVPTALRRKQRRLAPPLRPAAGRGGAQVRPALFTAHLQEQVEGLLPRLEPQRHVPQHLRQAKRLHHPPQPRRPGEKPIFLTQYSSTHDLTFCRAPTPPEGKLASAAEGTRGRSSGKDLWVQ